CGQGTNVPYSF
nr:immunoglobulin light chain junction region [Macaca mulatta]MOW11962.1 immunoglobulin light chain junction region [Macaca mulatta]